MVRFQLAGPLACILQGDVGQLDAALVVVVHASPFDTSFVVFTVKDGEVPDISLPLVVALLTVVYKGTPLEIAIHGTGEVEFFALLDGGCLGLDLCQAESLCLENGHGGHCEDHFEHMHDYYD